MKKIIEYVITILFSAIAYCGIICIVDLIDIYMAETKVYLWKNIMLLTSLENTLYYLLLAWMLLYAERKCLKSIWSEGRALTIGGICISYLLGNSLYHIIHRYIIIYLFCKNL